MLLCSSSLQMFFFSFINLWSLVLSNVHISFLVNLFVLHNLFTGTVRTSFNILISLSLSPNLLSFIFLWIILIPRVFFTWGVGDILHIWLDAEWVLGAGGFHLLVGVLRVVGTRRRSHELFRLFRPNVQGGGRRAVLTYTKMYVRTSASFASEMACKTKCPHEKGMSSLLENIIKKH